MSKTPVLHHELGVKSKKEQNRKKTIMTATIFPGHQGKDPILEWRCTWYDCALFPMLPRFAIFAVLTMFAMLAMLAMCPMLAMFGSVFDASANS